MDFAEHNALGDLVNQSWGKSSTAASGSPQFSINCRLLNDQRLIVDYSTIVNLGSAEEMHTRAKGLEADAMKLIKKYVVTLKDGFKEATGRALKLDIVSHHPSVEMISANPYNPKRTAYFRVTAVADYG